MGLRRRALEWYIRRWLSQARRGKKGEDVKNLLDLAARNKVKIGTFLAFIGGGLKYVGYEHIGDTVLVIGGLLIGSKITSDADAKARQ